ncbi:MAG TPA: bacterial transcriptional activator domain-containing protein [Longimicrobium sp.]|nr:bacterial transcriptional activator domain-containing protein [Longimicrobium sp.]
MIFRVPAQPLRIHLFGGLNVYRGEQPLPGFPTQKSRGLFAFLAVNHGRSHSRSTLVGRFWGDSPESVARKNLRTDLWRIRSVLEPQGVEPGSCLAVMQDEVALATGVDHWLDIHAFEDTLDEAAVRECGEARARLLRQAVDLYRGDLLEGVYDDWIIFERERLRLRYLDALERLIAHHDGRGEWTEAAAYAQRLLASDPLREHVHRAAIRCHLALGDRAAALRQFDTCARLLRQELDAEPAPETLALAAEARGETPFGRRASAPSAHASAAAMDEVLTRLRAAAQWLEETGEQVRIVIRDVERARALVQPPAVQKAAVQKAA